MSDNNMEQEQQLREEATRYVISHYGEKVVHTSDGIHLITTYIAGRKASLSLEEKKHFIAHGPFFIDGIREYIQKINDKELMVSKLTELLNETAKSWASLDKKEIASKAWNAAEKWHTQNKATNYIPQTEDEYRDAVGESQRELTLYQHPNKSAYLNSLDNSLPEQKDGWISVNERLPDKEHRVLIWEGGSCEICSYTSNYWTRNKYDFLDEQDEQPTTCIPSHWQPLPSQPK